VEDLETELERLTCTRYPLSVLLQRPLPDGVDPTLLEDYLEPEAFQVSFLLNIHNTNHYLPLFARSLIQLST